MGLERIDTPPPQTSGEVRPAIVATGHQQIPHDRSPGPTLALHNRRILHSLSVVVLVVGLAVTGTLTTTSRLNYVHNEQRLSNLQTRLTASALGVSPVDLERRLGQAAAAAGEASDPVGTFSRVIDPSMAPTGPFATASLALVHSGHVQVLAQVGAKTINSPTGSAASALYERAAKSASLVTTRVVGKGLQRLGYLMSFTGPGGTYVAAAGQSLPSNRRINVPANSPDGGLNVAIYFGKATTAAALVETNSLTCRSAAPFRRRSCRSVPAS